MEESAGGGWIVWMRSMDLSLGGKVGCGGQVGWPGSFKNVCVARHIPHFFLEWIIEMGDSD